MNKDSKIYVAGHSGLLGSAIKRKLDSLGYRNIIFKTSKELDLIDQKATFDFLEKEKPEYIFLSAAKVGGIQANIDNIGEFLYRNLQIQLNVIEGARRVGVKKLLFVASTCIYPTNVENPITEDKVLAGPIEPTNEGYGLAKVAGVRMCKFYRKQYGCDFISAIPCNLFGENDHYDAHASHVIQAIIRKVHEARENNQKEIEIWGSGKPRREFMLSDDCADALVFLMNNYSSDEPINVGTGVDHSILELAQVVSKALNYEVSFRLNTSKPDGIFRKLSDTKKLTTLGWKPKISLEEGIAVAYRDFLKHGVA